MIRNPFLPGNASPTQAQVAARRRFHRTGIQFAHEAVRLKSALAHAGGRSGVPQDMRALIDAAVDAGHVTLCPASMAYGVGRYDDLPGGAR